MASNRLCIIVRVYDRLLDLGLNLDIIRKYWKRNDYYIIIVSNGKSAGFEIPIEIRSKSDIVLELSENPGHKHGDSEMLRAAIPLIPEYCQFAVFLQADTWIFDDAVIEKYTSKLNSKSAVWASAEWVEKYWSLAIDMAIAKTSFIKANPMIFGFSEHPESMICSYLLANRYKFVYIKEMMPTHVPVIMRRLYNFQGGRFRAFPRAKSVTHHIEDLSGEMEAKKFYANICLSRKEFDIGNHMVISIRHFMLVVLMALAAILPRSKWFKGKRQISSQ